MRQGPWRALARGLAALVAVAACGRTSDEGLSAAEWQAKVDRKLDVKGGSAAPDTGDHGGHDHDPASGDGAGGSVDGAHHHAEDDGDGHGGDGHDGGHGGGSHWGKPEGACAAGTWSTLHPICLGNVGCTVHPVPPCDCTCTLCWQDLCVELACDLSPTCPADDFDEDAGGAADADSSSAPD